MANHINKISSPIVILADDLTGALDSSCTFSSNGYKTIVYCELPKNIEVIKKDLASNMNQVVVLNTETRNSTNKKIESMYDLLFSEYKWLFENSHPFKKVDSTGRGNIGFEINAILSKFHIPYAFVCLPYPELKRIQTMGIIKSEGNPIDHTQNNSKLPKDVRYQTEKSLEIQSGLKTRLVTQKEIDTDEKSLYTRLKSMIESNVKIICFDSLSRKDLNQIYNTTKKYFPKCLLVGSAGLTKSISESIAVRPYKPPKVNIQQNPFALISLSYHQTTKTHFTKLSDLKKISNITIDTDALQLDTSFNKEYKRVCSIIEDSIYSKTNIAIKQNKQPSLGTKNKSFTSKRLHKFLSIISTKLMSYDFYKTFILIGGDTANIVLKTASIGKIEAIEEILPGTILSLPLPENNVRFNIITKSGGFGSEDQISELISKLL